MKLSNVTFIKKLVNPAPKLISSNITDTSNQYYLLNYRAYYFSQVIDSDEEDEIITTQC